MSYQMSHQNYYEEEMEYMDDCTLPEEYMDTIHNELKTYNQVNHMNFYTKGYRVLYLVRMYERYKNRYVFKIGSTENLEQRIKQLNSNRKYDCCGRIIIVGAAIVHSLDDEMYVHNKLANYRLEDSGLEVYELNYDVYNQFNELLDMFPYTFKSYDYVFEDDGTELISFELSDEMEDELQLTDNMVELDCDYNELKYWYLRRVM